MLSYDEFLFGESKQVDTDNNERFVEKRRAGAEDIAHKASTKGGYAELTAWHFKAKLPKYKEALKAVKNREPLAFFERKYKETMDSLHGTKLSSQKQFQKIMGELEVWGEIVIQLKSGKSY